MAVHRYHGWWVDGCTWVPWMVGKWLCTDTMEHMWLLDESVWGFILCSFPCGPEIELRLNTWWQLPLPAEPSPWPCVWCRYSWVTLFIVKSKSFHNEIFTQACLHFDHIHLQRFSLFLSPCHLPSSSSFYFPKLCVCVWIKYTFHIWEKICSSCPSESGVFPFKSVIYMALCIFLQLIPFQSHVWAMFSSHPLMGI